MQETQLTCSIREQTRRALWEVQNVIGCVPHDLWQTEYCGVPLARHVYHMLHSLDQWFINPNEYVQPKMHTEGLNDLNADTDFVPNRAMMEAYLQDIRRKIGAYLDELTDEMLSARPESCEYTRMTLIIAQHRHLHTHMGMIMGFIVAKTGRWPYVAGLAGDICKQASGLYFE